MIHRLRFSIRNKLIAIQLFISFVVLLLFSVFLLVNQMHVFQNSVEARMTSLAQILSRNCMAALDFGDLPAAEDMLGTLEAEGDVANAWIADAHGQLFARYQKKGVPPFDYPRLQAPKTTVGAFFIYRQAMVRNKEHLGDLYLRFSMSEYEPVLWKNIWIAVGVFVVGMVLSLFLAILTQRSLATPLLQLARTLRRVSATGDFSLRVETKREDEIGVLGEGFNSMLDQIQRRIQERNDAEAALKLAYDGMESTVSERTAELASANARLQELDQLKSMFMASMSHELRTPLNSIIGFTGLLLMGLTGELNNEQKTQLGMVKSSAQHLLSLINDILDISKIESGRVQLVTEEFDLREIVDEVLSSLQPQADRKGLVLAQAGEHDVRLTNDRRRVKQVLMNLVTNAVKFTDNGEVRVEVQTDGPLSVKVRVSDTGIGIAAADMAKLFQPFQQIDMSSTKRHEGTGLGLYLCSKLVEMLHGEISADSVLGKGSVFELTLPLQFQEGAVK